jgi:hypothetical protein
MSETTAATQTLSTTPSGCCFQSRQECLETFLPLFFLVGFGSTLLLGGPFVGLLFALFTLTIYVVSRERHRRRGLLAIQRPPSASSDPVILVQQQSSSAAKPTVDLSTLTLRTVQAEESILTCEICLDDMQEGEEVAASPNPECIHEFHARCIFQALQRQTTCPCCRREYLLLSLLLPEVTRCNAMDIERGVAADAEEARLP